MIKRNFICPFTGSRFEALQDCWGNLVVTNPVIGKNMHVNLDQKGEFYLVPVRYLTDEETMTSSEAAEYLGVSRQRVSNLATYGIVSSFSVDDKPMFLKRDIIEYAETRTVGRPKKEVQHG